jgi:hypothetical protein
MYNILIGGIDTAIPLAETAIIRVWNGFSGLCYVGDFDWLFEPCFQ